MIKSLIYKEFHLNVVAWAYIWLAVGALLLLVPAWPYFVAIGYLFILFLQVVNLDKANQDLAFAISLPVPKSGIVTARTCSIVLLELGQLVAAVPFAVIRYWLYPEGNLAGMNTNLAFFGLMLVMFAVFNLIFLPGFYKSAYRVLWPVGGGALVSVVLVGTLTTLIALLPGLQVLNDRGLGHLGLQLAVLGGGLLVFAGFTLLAHHRAQTNFASVDL